MMLTIALFTLAALSLVLMLWQWIVSRRFQFHQRIANASFAPPITILKPLKGADPCTPACLRSWFEQSYTGPIQVLFGVASSADPACQLAGELIAEFPQLDAELVVCPETLGANGKMSTLAQLQERIKHEIVVVSDADVKAPSDLLQSSVEQLRDENIGLVTCLYRLANPSTIPMHWEAVAINCDFWSQVLQARSIKPLEFALGAVMMTRRTQLEAVGGFRSLADYLADDYFLGYKIAERGYRIQLSRVVVDCWAPPMSWKSVWRHQLRWARTIRTSKPFAYFFSLLANPTLWPMLFLASHPTAMAFAFSAGCVVLRGWTAFDQLRRMLSDRPPLTSLLMVWPKDLLHTAIWIASFLGNKIEWRGERYEVLPDGRLHRPTSEAVSVPH